MLTSYIYRCIDHTIHIMAAHFIKKLNIQSLQSTKCTLLHSFTMLQSRDDLDDEYGKDFDIETCMEAEAGPAEADAILETYSTNFIAGDAVGKLMAFISQIWASGEVTQDYLHELCKSNNCLAWEIKLWICTHWGSLGLIQWLLSCSAGSTASRCICLFSDTIANFHSQAINIFFVLADENEDIPPIANSEKWSNYKLTGVEWQLIQLAHNCLSVHSYFVTFLFHFHLCWL